MSHFRSTAASSSSPSSSSTNFQLIINDALDTYKKRTKKDLRAHPLASQLQTCESPTAIFAVLQEQVQGLDQSRSANERWTKWLDPTVNVLYAFSDTLGASVSLLFSPASVIFAGVGILLSAAKDVRASEDTVVDIFERIGMFFRRLGIYTEVSPTKEMMDLIIQIMVEILCIFGIATKEIKQGRMKKYAKRLDKLTHEEAWMGIAQNLKATHTVGESVREVADKVVVIDNRVRVVGDGVADLVRDGREAKVAIQQTANTVVAIDNRVADVGDCVASVDDRVKVVDDRVAEVSRDGKEVKVVIQQTATDIDQVKVATHQTATVVDQVMIATQQTAADVDQVKRNQLRESIHKWLSPPDPSTNHNIACGTHHKKTASWFFQGSIFQEWKSTGSLLWIHGKPGSGKSILCSTVIQDIQVMCKAGDASMAYFYFDFRDVNKQGLRDLVSPLLTQLSASSGLRCNILSNFYLAHDEGKIQPSDSALAECLKRMLTLPDQLPTYLIIDALDESSNTSGIPSPRERVLQLLEELVNLRLPDLRICVTSRPEVDIRDVLEPLTSRRVSLHDQTGQKEDIVDYVKSVVYSNSEPIMKRWRTDDKELVVNVLSERADGMFRWIFCQLEVLRYCLPPSVRHTLDELPESLDETYERILKEIKKPNRDHALRVLQCLVVAIRPLRVEELAEVLAVNFDDEEGMPKLNPHWRWDDQEQALLSSCSSLIAIVKSNGSRIVQFSHFSVKEFLTSARLATSGEDVSRYYIDLEPAHIILAQACIAVLLRSDDSVEESWAGVNSPLARYAAEHWVVHAQIEKVSTRLRKAMEYLFDAEKPYFAAWLNLFDIDTEPPTISTFYMFTPISKLSGTPLYYAALCGFRDLVEHLIVDDPKQVNAEGGYYLTPFVAALGAGHFPTVQSFHDNGANPNVKGYRGNTPLHSAAGHQDFELVQVLLKYKADVHVRNDMGYTPLHSNAGNSSPQSLSSVARLLLEHGADVNTRDNDRSTPLHRAARNGYIEVVRVLLEHGADVGAKDKDGKTVLQEVSGQRRDEIMKLLSEYGAR